VSASKLDLMAMLRDIRRAGGRIYGIGAPSRASTMGWCWSGQTSCVYGVQSPSLA
jgi:hypothetical protein